MPLAAALQIDIEWWAAMLGLLVLVLGIYGILRRGEDNRMKGIAREVFAEMSQDVVNDTKLALRSLNKIEAKLNNGLFDAVAEMRADMKDVTTAVAQVKGIADTLTQMWEQRQ